MSAGAARKTARQAGAIFCATPFGHVRDLVAGARRLAGEDDLAARLQHAEELAERLVEVGQVVQDRVADDEVELLVVERQPLGVGDLAS